MSIPLVAKALGSGVEIAALTPYAKWHELLLTKESVSDVLRDESGGFATYELIAVQALNDNGDSEIEVRVLASDARNELKAYFYAKPSGVEGAK